MKPDLYIQAVSNGYIVKALHPETSELITTRVATYASAYSSDSLSTACDYLLLMDIPPVDLDVAPSGLDGDSPEEAINYDKNVDHDAA